MNGIIPVYKEKGCTSFAVIARLRRILGERKLGHTGTLDPDAEGVLIVCAGGSTKLISMFADDSKAYDAVMRFGITTDTQDIGGKVLQEREVRCTAEEAKECILSFEGPYLQTPPAYSAKQVDGKRLYALARAGKEAVAPPKEVMIDRITVSSVDLPYASFSVDCSKGTYIRTLCHDAGEKLGCGGTLISLLRTRCGRVKLSDAHTLEQIEKAKAKGEDSFLIPPGDFFAEYPEMTVSGRKEYLAVNGNRFSFNGPWTDGQLVKVFGPDRRMLGFFRYDRPRRLLRPHIMFPRESDQ